MKHERQTSKKKKKIDLFIDTFVYIISGGFLKGDFVVKHTRMIILVVIMLVFFIGNRYTCLLKLREIDRLQKELQDVRYESIDISGQLTGRNRRSQIEQLVKAQGLPLESAKTPPYILRRGMRNE